MIHLVTGGARSGKSRFVLGEAEAAVPGGIVFVATAQPLDHDMAGRIRRHQEERGPRWTTVEEPLDLCRALARAPGEAVVVDCLTLWVSNLLFSPEGGDDAWIEARFPELVDALRAQSRPVWLVTNEVGLGIVPADALSRRYRDLLGRCNQRVAATADRVTLLVAGLPLAVR